MLAEYCLKGLKKKQLEKAEADPLLNAEEVVIRPDDALSYLDGPWSKLSSSHLDTSADEEEGSGLSDAAVSKLLKELGEQLRASLGGNVQAWSGYFNIRGKGAVTIKEFTESLEGLDLGFTSSVHLGHQIAGALQVDLEIRLKTVFDDRSGCPGGFLGAGQLLF